MIPEDASRIFRLMSTAFPPIHDYIDRLSDWPATKIVWCKMLVAVKYEDAVTAVDRMISGEAQPPQASWEIGMLPAHIRGVAGRVAQDRAKVLSAQASQRLTFEKNQRCGFDNYKSVASFWRAAYICNRKGLIDDVQLNGFWQDVVRFNRSPQEPITVPDVLQDEYKRVLSGKSKSAFESVFNSVPQ